MPVITELTNSDLIQARDVELGETRTITFANFMSSEVSGDADNSLSVGDDGKLFASGGGGGAGSSYTTKSNITYADAIINPNIQLVAVNEGDIIVDIWFRLLEAWDVAVDFDFGSADNQYEYISVDLSDTSYLDQSDDPDFAISYNNQPALRSGRDTNTASGAGNGYFTFPLIAKRATALYANLSGDDIGTATQGILDVYVTVVRAP